ncbi:hypothetical protein CDAR_605781 [Caerostris darwini]|uniref:Uncharacterized protein n=1 Tax=Caerostris darwini TaxID=1538125 RepID=A0AAV4UA55_9ARAC|nr:hypothetical protein CDAR_605781 [Caerostris darwini]
MAYCEDFSTKVNKGLHPETWEDETMPIGLGREKTDGHWGREGFKSPTLLSPLYISFILKEDFSRIAWKTVEDYGRGGSKKYNLQRPSTDFPEPTEKQFGEGLPRLPTTTLQIKKKKKISCRRICVFPLFPQRISRFLRKDSNLFDKSQGIDIKSTQKKNPFHLKSEYFLQVGAIFREEKPGEFHTGNGH